MEEPIKKNLKEKVEELANTQEDMKQFHKDMQIFHKEISKEKKIMIACTIGTLIVVAGVIIFFGWLFWNGSLKSMLRARTLSIQVEDITTSVEFKMMVDETKMMIEGLRKVAPKYDSSFAGKPTMSETEIEDYNLEIFKAKRAGDLPDADWFRANSVAESELNPRSYSKAGAIGINQLMKDTSKWVCTSLLSIYDDVDIWNVKMNTRIAIRYWIFIRRYLRFNLGRQPTPVEIAMGYNCGHTAVLRAIISGDPEEYLPRETIKHGNKVKFYKESYEKKNYAQWYYERYSTNNVKLNKENTNANQPGTNG